MLSTCSSGFPVRRQWLRVTVNQCQIAAGDAVTSEIACAAVGERILRAAPRPSSHLEALLLQGFVAEAIVRRAVATGGLPKQCSEMLSATTTAASIGPSGGHDDWIHPKVAHALHVIRRSSNQPDLRLTWVARSVGVTPSHLSRLLHRDAGVGFSAYLRSIRLDKSRRLLKDPQVSIKQVASTVGYKHPGDFSQQFKTEYGVTPTTWRERRVARTK